MTTLIDTFDKPHSLRGLIAVGVIIGGVAIAVGIRGQVREVVRPACEPTQYVCAPEQATLPDDRPEAPNTSRPFIIRPPIVATPTTAPFILEPFILGK